MNLDSESPLVSICCITYNHEKYIRDAIEGFLMQQTDFRFEVIIHDDASTDTTPAIVRDYANKYPDLIKPIFQSENQYSKNPMVRAKFVLPRATGKYIAICDGDDYWTSPHKLQRQVDYMEAHPECRICFHATRVVFEDDPERPATIRTPPPNQVVNFENWLRYRAKYASYAATSSILYRSVNQPLPDWYHQLRFSGDWALVVWLLLQGGKLRFVHDEEPMSVYRKHSRGVTNKTALSGSPDRVKSLLDDLHDHIVVNAHLTGRLRQCLRPRFFKLHMALANEYLLLGEKNKVKFHLLKSVFYMSVFSKRDIKSVFRCVVQCYLPGLYPKLVSLNARIRNMYRPLHTTIH